MTHAASFASELAQPAPARQRKFPLVAMLLLVGLAITLAGIFPFRQMIAQQRQVDQTEARLESLLEGNRSLEETITALHSAPEIERLAREEYGLVRPGETAYSVETPPQPVSGVVESAVEEAIDERSLLQRFWDFLTGRDLVPDE